MISATESICDICVVETDALVSFVYSQSRRYPVSVFRTGCVCHTRFIIANFNVRYEDRYSTHHG